MLLTASIQHKYSFLHVPALFQALYRYFTLLVLIILPYEVATVNSSSSIFQRKSFMIKPLKLSLKGQACNHLNGTLKNSCPHPHLHPHISWYKQNWMELQSPDLQVSIPTSNAIPILGPPPVVIWIRDSGLVPALNEVPLGPCRI